MPDAYEIKSTKSKVRMVEPSSRILALARPQKRHLKRQSLNRPEIEQYTSPYEVPKEYAHVRSLGIRKLAKPAKQRKKYVRGDEIVMKVPNEISKNALKCKASMRVVKLAMPMPSRLEKQKQNCFSVNPKAFKKLNKARRECCDRLAKPSARYAKKPVTPINV